MKSIKNKSEIVFTEKKTIRNKDRSISRYGIIQLIEIPSGGENVSTPKWFEKWCTEEFKPFKEETKQSIESLRTEFNEFKEETRQNIDSLNNNFDKVNEKIDNLIIRNKLKV